MSLSTPICPTVWFDWRIPHIVAGPAGSANSYNALVPQSATLSAPWASLWVVRASSVGSRVTPSSPRDSWTKFSTSEGGELPLIALKARSCPPDLLDSRFPGTDSSEIVAIVCRSTWPFPTADSSPCSMVPSAGWPSLLIRCCLYFLRLFRTVRFADLASSRFATVLGSWI